jgi:hypothetical protein
MDSPITAAEDIVKDWDDPTTSAFGAQPSHRLCLLRAANLRLLLLGLDFRSGRWANARLATLLALAFTITFEGLEPVGIDNLPGKAGQLVEEFMSRFGKQLLGLMLTIQGDHHASVFRGEVEDGLPQANEEVLSLTGDQFLAD